MPLMSTQRLARIFARRDRAGRGQSVAGRCDPLAPENAEIWPGNLVRLAYYNGSAAESEQRERLLQTILALEDELRDVRSRLSECRQAAFVAEERLLATVAELHARNALHVAGLKALADVLDGGPFAFEGPGSPASS